MSIASNTSQSPSLKVKASELSPLKLCIKFNPFSLALYYTLVSSKDKKFLHTINIEKDINSDIPTEDIYAKLLEREPGYWNPKTISKKQVIKLIEKLKERHNNNSVISDKNKGSGRGSQYEKITSMESGVYSNPVLVTNTEDIKTENLSNSNSPNIKKDSDTDIKHKDELMPELKSDKKPEENKPFTKNKNEDLGTLLSAGKDIDIVKKEINQEKPVHKKEVLANQLDKEFPEDDEEPKKPTEIKQELAQKAIEDFKHDNEENSEELNKGGMEYNEENEEEMAKMMEKEDMQRVYQEMLISIFLNCYVKFIDKGERMQEEGLMPENLGPMPDNGEELSPEEVEYLRGFQKVFVEDLGQELLMDPAGNLYDMEGNLIGQAASDGEGEEEGGQGNNEDRKYFEEEPDFEPPPMKKPETKKQAKKLPPVGGPKGGRSHSP